jgi:D-lactate dehydrogenase
MGFDLKGKILGVIGTGHIGLHVIRMAKGFGLEVLAFDVKKNTFLSEVLDFSYASLEELLAKSDIISLHVPYRKATHHLIHEGNISQIKRGAILINTARGGLVETAALVKALDQGILSGAGLDVLEGEELILEEKRLVESKERRAPESLLHRDNVIYTPHMAFYSKEAVLRILDTTLNNIRSFFAGAPENRVEV